MKSQLNSQQSSASSSSQPSAPIEAATVSSLTASTTTATAVAAPRVVVSSDASDSNINMTIVNQSVSRKNSKVSLKSSNSSSDGCNHKDDIIASMVKDRMRELEESQDVTNNELIARMGHMSRANSHDSNAATDQITHQTAFNDLNRSTNNNQIICDAADDGQSVHSSNTACNTSENNETTLTTCSGSSKGTITSGNSNRNSIQLAAGTSSNVSIKTTSSHNASDLSRKSSNSSSQTISQNLKSSSGRKYSRSHQRRFHRRFPEVEEKEMLIDWFNCALIADILLQGYLYISDNYFAFYSNIFGYKTHILIPVSDVVSVTKEKTAKIFPNAVGICTDEAKYVFGSLISRESAYKLMQEVWRSTLYQVASVSFETARLKANSELNQETDSAINSASSNGGSSKETLSTTSINRTSSANSGEFKKTASLEKRTDLHINGVTGEDEDIDDEDDDDDDDDDDSDMSQAENIGDLRSLLAQRTPIDSRTGRFYGVLRSVSNISCSSLGSMMKSRDNLMLLATLTLVILFISATFLIYRASRVQSRLYNLGLDGKTASDGQTSGDGSYDEAYNSPWFGGINRNSLLFSNQVNRITSKLQSKIHEVTDLRVELEQLLKIVLQIQTSDSANDEQPGNCDKTLCT